MRALGLIALHVNESNEAVSFQLRLHLHLCILGEGPDEALKDFRAVNVLGYAGSIDSARDDCIRLSVCLFNWFTYSMSRSMCDIVL